MLRPNLIPSWDLVKPSWRLVVENFEAIIFLYLLPALVIALGTVLLGDTRLIHHFADLSPRQWLGLKIAAVGGLWSLINAAPALYFQAKVAGGKTISLGDAYRQGLKYFWRLIGMFLLFGIIVIGGLILLILPGLLALFIIIHRYYLAGYYLVDQDLGIRQALLRSHHETAPFTPYVWGIVGVQLTFTIIASIVSGLLFQYGPVASAFIGVICLFLPALRYHEIRHANSHLAAIKK